MENKDTIILQVKDLVAAFKTETGLLKAVDGISFDLKRGSALGIVGESGCGKSVTAFSIMRLLPKPAGQYPGGQILYNNMDILKLPPAELHHIRGNKISMIFQEPMTALNPVQTIGKQIAEIFELHFPDLNKEQVLKASIGILNKVGIPDPELRLNNYPHQLSGGMRQRIMIAIALSCKPEILIADEPTTALDVTIQAQILELIRSLQQESGTSVIFITHDLGVVAQLCHDVLVMYAGKIIEKAPVQKLFQSPKHPYTQGLMNSIPRLDHEHKSTLKTIKGMVPAIAHYPTGCRFRDRCDRAFASCGNEPMETKISEDHSVCCHLYN